MTREEFEGLNISVRVGVGYAPDDVQIDMWGGYNDYWRAQSEALQTFINQRDNSDALTPEGLWDELSVIVDKARDIMWDHHEEIINDPPCDVPESKTSKSIDVIGTFPTEFAGSHFLATVHMLNYGDTATTMEQYLANLDEYLAFDCYIELEEDETT